MLSYEQFALCLDCYVLPGNMGHSGYGHGHGHGNGYGYGYGKWR
jgi:hypothetical protein